MQLLSAEDFTAVEHLAYEAAVLPELWPKLLEKVCHLSGTAAGAILCMNERGEHMLYTDNFERTVLRWKDENWRTRNSRAGSVFRKNLVGVPRFVNDDDMFEPGEIEADPMVRELFRAEGFGWAAGFIVQLPHGDVVVMNIEQKTDLGPIRGESLARLDSLYSPLARALTLSARTSFQRVQLAVDTLTGLGLPAAALSATGRVLIANDKFAWAQHIWTTRGQDKLGLLDPQAQIQLGEALAQIGLANGVRSIPVRADGTGKITAVIQVVPVRRAAHDVFNSAAAILVLSETANDSLSSTLIKSLFDLTVAEIFVAKAVAAGHSVQDIAVSSGRSVNTVRTQLKSIMAKTGCTRQLELAMLVRQLGQPMG